jgi:hypothetical protein
LLTFRFGKKAVNYFQTTRQLFGKGASRFGDRSEKRKAYNFHSISSAIILDSCHVPFSSVVNEQQVQNICFAFRWKSF